MITTPNIDTHLESSKQRESTCITAAAILHVLALLWNPIILKSDFHPAHDFVTVDVVEEPAPGGGSPAAEEPKKAGLMQSLKDMLIKPKPEEIAHIAPEPQTSRVAAPLQPVLKDRVMPRSMQTFQPRSTAEDIATANTPNAIQTNSRPLPNLTNAAPTLQAKSFGGIRAKDLPFQVGTDQALTGGGAAIPIAVGNSSAKSGLAYGGATLNESKGKPILQNRGGIISGSADVASLGAGSANSIQLSGTGGTGNAPTGAPSGSVLRDRAGSGGGSLSGRGGSGYGTGRGSGFGSGIGGMPSAAAQLEQQLDSSSSGGGKKVVGNKGFELAGPLTNRPIMKKVIPQYPAWAEEQGIIGSVRLYFTVTPEGTVRSNIRVTKTTGYPQLDELAIEALKQWRFATVSSSDEGKGEWGIITFNFALSS